MRIITKKVMCLVCMFIMLLQTTVVSFAAVNQTALDLGFEVDTNVYKNIGWINERSSDITFTDVKKKTCVVGKVYHQTVFATLKENYLGNNQMDVWMTRAFTEMKSGVKCNVTGNWGFTQEKTLSFSLQEVSEYDEMPRNIKLASYVATTPATQLAYSIKQNWSVTANNSLSYNKLKIGASTGVSWSKSTDKLLCSLYNSSRQDKFSVKYSLLDPYYETMTKNQKSYCNGLCYFYSTKCVYGSKSTMKKYTAPTSITARAVAHYTMSVMGSLSVVDIYAQGTTATRAAIEVR